MNKEKIKRGFTLAEVLITIGIIGVVAAITIPALITKHQEKRTVTQVKKIYSVLNEAARMAKAEKGSYTGNTKEEFYEYLSPYLKIGKSCGTGAGCLGNPIKYLGGREWGNIDGYKGYIKFMLIDGTSIILNADGYQNSAEIRVDINGKQEPNTHGRDIFIFSYSPIDNMIYPNGISRNGVLFNIDEKDESFRAYCNLGSLVEKPFGGPCTAWVIYQGNMDYLHCNDLSWKGKNKCSR